MNDFTLFIIFVVIVVSIYTFFQMKLMRDDHELQDDFKPIYITEVDVDILIQNGWLVADLTDNEPLVYAERQNWVKAEMKISNHLEVFKEYILVAVPINYVPGYRLINSIKNSDVPIFLVETDRRYIAEFCNYYIHEEKDFEKKRENLKG